MNKIVQPRPLRLFYPSVMRPYRFSIHGADGLEREMTGSIALRDDDDARKFGEAIISDLLDGDDSYADCTMNIIADQRTVYNLRILATTLPDAVQGDRP